MSIVAGQTIVAADFLTSSAGAGSSGKAIKLDANGLADRTFLTNALLQSFVADEAITTGQSVIVGTGLDSIPNGSNTPTGTNQNFSDTTWLSQNFTTGPRAKKIPQITLNLTSSSGSSITVTAQIYAVDGSNKPTGAALGTATNNGVFNGPSVYTFTFGTPAPVSPSTTYAIVIFRPSGAITTSWNGGTGDTTGFTSTNSGSTWSGTTGNRYYTTNETQTTAFHVMLSRTNPGGGGASPFTDNFIGIAESTVTAGQSVVVRPTGISNALSGLSAGVQYLQDTAGTLGTSPGTVSRKVGVAMSATQLLIRTDNP